MGETRIASGTRVALLIAASHFEDPKFAGLRAPARDVEALERVLTDTAIGGFQVRSLVNEPHWKITEEIEGFFADRKPDDLLLLYFSCHGVKDVAGRLYFATSTTRFSRLASTGISSAWINEQLDRSRSRREVLLLDCCYSGAFAKGLAPRGGDTVEIPERLGGRGRAVITASNAMEYAWEGDELALDAAEPSVFTRALVGGLETGEADRDGDGFVAVDELYDYIYDQVREATPHQTPTKSTFGEQGNLLIATNPNPPPPPVEPVPLPPELESALYDRRTWVRKAAANELRQLLLGDDERLALSAARGLELLAEDDASPVRATARKALKEQARRAGVPSRRATDSRRGREAEERRRRVVEKARRREPGERPAWVSEEWAERLTPLLRELRTYSWRAVRAAAKPLLVALLVAGPLAVLAIGVMAWWESRPTPPISARYDLSGAQLAVGSREFPEQLILSQLTRLALEEAGASVDAAITPAEDHVVRAALEAGDVDVYWQYTGRVLMRHLGGPDLLLGADRQYETVAARDEEEHGIVWAERAPFNRTYGIAARGEDADERGLHRLADLPALFVDEPEQATLCVTPAFVDLSVGLQGLEARYGITFPEDGLVFHESETTFAESIYRAIGWECTFGVVLTTDWRIGALDLQVLEDDRQLFPIHEPAATIRQEVVEEFPEIVDLMSEIAEGLDTFTIQGLEAAVEDEGLSPEQAAADHLSNLGLTG